LPIFFGIFGGIIGYFILKNVDLKKSIVLIVVENVSVLERHGRKQNERSLKEA